VNVTRENTPHPIGHVRVLSSDLPTVAEVTALTPAAGKVIGAMHGLIAETRTAIGAVIESRYKGSIWEAAAAADRKAVVTGEKPEKLSTLIAGEPERYALAVALAGALEQRLDATRHAGRAAFEKASEAARRQQTAHLDDAAALVEQGWPQRASARGLVALEDAEKLVEQAQRLEHLIRWLTGEDKRIDSNRDYFLPGLDPVARGRLTAFGHDRNGNVPMTWSEAAMGVRPLDWKPATRTTITAA
jgi:hypothetical protein